MSEESLPDNCREYFEQSWPQYAKDDKAWFCFSSGWSHCLIYLLEQRENNRDQSYTQLNKTEGNTDT